MLSTYLIGLHPRKHFSQRPTCTCRLKGGRSGLAKALAQESTRMQQKSSGLLGSPRKELAAIVHQELRSIDAVTEVYYETLTDSP